MDNISLILANLTQEDDRRFHAARISYTGSTGPGAKPDNYGGLAPYIATYPSVLDRAVKAMGWKKFSLEADAGQWVVRCESRDRTIADDTPQLEHSQYGRPVIWIADFYYRTLPGTAVPNITNRCVFASREQAIRWAKFQMRDEIDWATWTAPQGDYPYEAQRDDLRLDPTFVATVKRTMPEGTIFKRVSVSRTEVCGEFDWWASDADGDWNAKPAAA